MKGPYCSAAAQGPLTPTLSPEGRGRRASNAGRVCLDGAVSLLLPSGEKVAEGRMSGPSRFLSAAQGPPTPAPPPRMAERRMRRPVACSAAAQGPLTPALSRRGEGEGASNAGRVCLDGAVFLLLPSG